MDIIKHNESAGVAAASVLCTHLSSLVLDMDHKSPRSGQRNR
jgi:hypothetical protein